MGYNRIMAEDIFIYGLIAAAALALVFLAGALRFTLGRKRSRRRQYRLGLAFERARIVGRTGSGLQGTPYSVYGESSWSDYSDSSR